MDKENAKKNSFLSPEDIEKGKALMKECKELKRQVEDKISKSQGRSGFSIKELKEFFETKTNFPEEKWNRLLEEKGRFDSAFKGFKAYKSAATKKSPKSSLNKNTKKIGNRARQRPGWLSL